MKKYLSFFRLRFINGMQYRAAALAGVVTQFAWGFMEILMFMAFYKADKSAFPMGISELSSYIWMQQAFLALFMVWFMEGEIFDSIHNGNIAYELCRPIDLYNMWFARSLATRLSRAVLRSMPILFIAAILPKPYGLVMTKDFIGIVWFFITMVLAFLIVAAFCMIIYIITFFTISPMGVRMVATSVVEFFAGAVIPIPFFPENIKKILELLPFGSMQNVPFLIFSGHIAGSEIYRAVVIQLIWLILLIVIGKMLTVIALKKVVIQGG